MPIETLYPDNPWAAMETNQREFYDPVLRDTYYNDAIYNRLVTTQFDTHGLPDADSMTITNLMLPHGNFNPIDMRGMWMKSSRIDTFSRTVGIARYGAKMSLHKHDPQVNQLCQ